MEVDHKEYQLRCELHGHEDDVRGICVCGGERDTIATSSSDRTVRVWSVSASDRRKYESGRILLGHTSFVGPLAWVPRNDRYPEGGIVSGGMDTLVLVWDLKTGEKVQTLSGHQSQVTGLVLDDNADIVSSSVDCTIRRWRDGKPIESWQAHDGPVQAIIKLPSGELVSGSSDQTSKLWRGKTCAQTFSGHSDTVRGLAVMPDLGILSASHDGSIRLWAVTGQVLMEMVGHTSVVYSVDSHASGLVVSASEDCSAKIWRDGACVQSLEHPGCVWDAKFLADGDIVTACSDGVVRIWTTHPDKFADPLDIESFTSQLSAYKLSGTVLQEEEEEVKTFEALGVCEHLVTACKNQGWLNPTKIQVEAIPPALEGKDLIGLAQTGSGKTGAFALPILQALIDAPQPFFACVLSPTRELAIQIAEQFSSLGSDIGVRCAVLVGGVDMVQQTLMLGKQPHIVVGTPGRLVDHLSNTKGFSLRRLKYLVLDEADRLLNEDFEKSIDEILSVIPRGRRTYLFSATMTKKVKKLQRACLKNPVKIEAASKYSTVDTLKQQYLFIPAKYKDFYLVYVLTEKSGCSSMVFTRTCEATRLLALILRNLGFRAIPISGQMTQSKRLGALNKFKAGECNILICTDVASRGLDIPSVDTVINYDIPSNSKDYIHRVGRTARAGRSGVAISLVSQYELEWYIQIENLIGKKLDKYPAEEEEVLLLSERVYEAKRISQMKIKDSNGHIKRRKRQGDDDEEDVQRNLGVKNGNKFKRSKK